MLNADTHDLTISWRSLGALTGVDYDVYMNAEPSETGALITPAGKDVFEMVYNAASIAQSTWYIKIKAEKIETGDVAESSWSSIYILPLYDYPIIRSIIPLLEGVMINNYLFVDADEYTITIQSENGERSVTAVNTDYDRSGYYHLDELIPETTYLVIVECEHNGQIVSDKYQFTTEPLYGGSILNMPALTDGSITVNIIPASDDPEIKQMVRVSRDETFATIEQEIEDITETQITITGLSPGVIYYLMLLAYKDYEGRI